MRTPEKPGNYSVFTLCFLASSFFPLEEIIFSALLIWHFLLYIATKFLSSNQNV